MTSAPVPVATPTFTDAQLHDRTFWPGEDYVWCPWQSIDGTWVHRDELAIMGGNTREIMKELCALLEDSPDRQRYYGREILASCVQEICRLRGLPQPPTKANIDRLSDRGRAELRRAMNIQEACEALIARGTKPGNGAGGSLHIVLDDGNVDDENVLFCVSFAEQQIDSDGVALARLLLMCSKTQRIKLGGARR